MMITVALIDKETLYTDDILNFSVELDEVNQQIKIYHIDEYIGILKSVCGISEDEFVSQIKYKEN